MSNVLVLFSVSLVVAQAQSCQQPDRPTKDLPIGQEISRFFVRDANSQRCLLIEGSKVFTKTIVDDAFCSGHSLDADPVKGRP